MLLYQQQWKTPKWQLTLNKPYKAKGIPRAKTRLIVSEPALLLNTAPKIWNDLLLAVPKGASVNSLDFVIVT